MKGTVCGCKQEIFEDSVRYLFKASRTLPMPTPTPPPADTRSLWTPAFIALAVACALVLLVSNGLRQSLGLFMAPMAADFGTSAATFGFAMAAQNLIWGIAQPFVGMLADRHGAGRVILGAALAYAAGLALMALGGPFGLQAGGGVILGLAIAGTSFGVVLAAVSRAAPAAIRPTAVSLVSAAGSIGTLLMAPLGQGLINGTGWVVTLLVFAAIALAMGVAAFFTERRPPVATSGRPQAGDAVREALGHGGFVAMCIAFFACGFQLIFIAVHLPKYLAICGIGPGVSATALGLIGLFNAIGTIVVARMGQLYGDSRILALVYLLRTLAIVVFVALPVTVASTLVFAAVMGFLWLSVAPLVSGIITRMFGLANFATLFGVMFFSHQVGSFLGAWLGGLTYDLSGSYMPAWVALVVIGAAAALIQVSADDQPRARPA
jgi:predicted MFS family arabinose efflux permease